MSPVFPVSQNDLLRRIADVMMSRMYTLKFLSHVRLCFSECLGGYSL